VRLTRVGVKNLKLNLRIVRERDSLPLFPTIDLIVDLPSDKRGVHLSRNPELLYEVLEGRGVFKSSSIEDFCSVIARRLLEKHDYSNKAEVRLRSSYIVTRKPVLGNPTPEPCKIFAAATASKRNRDIVVQRMVGVSVIGFTACPCTQNLLRALTEEKLRKMGYMNEDVKKIMENVPLATHTQRTIGTILMQVPNGFTVNIEDLIDIIEGSMSGKTYSLLKRPSEASVVIEAYERPRFTEDVVREMLNAIAKKYENFPDETRVLVQAYSQESVHKHDVIAERVATLEEIRAELNGGA
jgi:GTP cyclohydrolase-4